MLVIKKVVSCQIKKQKSITLNTVAMTWGCGGRSPDDKMTPFTLVAEILYTWDRWMGARGEEGGGDWIKKVK